MDLPQPGLHSPPTAHPKSAMHDPSVCPPVPTASGFQVSAACSSLPRTTLSTILTFGPSDHLLHAEHPSPDRPLEANLAEPFQAAHTGLLRCTNARVLSTPNCVITPCAHSFETSSSVSSMPSQFSTCTEVQKQPMHRGGRSRAVCRHPNLSEKLLKRGRPQQNKSSANASGSLLIMLSIAPSGSTQPVVPVSAGQRPAYILH